MSAILDLKNEIAASKIQIQNAIFLLKVEKNNLKNLKHQLFLERDFQREEKRKQRLQKLIEKNAAPVGIKKKRLDRRPGKVETVVFPQQHQSA